MTVAIPESVLESVKQLSSSVLDAYALLDTQQNIVHFNQVFHSLFPRHVARKLKRAVLGDVLTLELNGEPFDLAGECMTSGNALRYDEIVGRLQDGRMLALIASAAPIFSRERVLAGVFVSLRNVTDEAQVQLKYKTMLEHEARQRELLTQEVRDAEAELVRMKDRLNAVESELRDYKKGLLL